MEIFKLVTERDAIEFCIRYKPKRCVKFKRNGDVFAAWIVIAGVGELYTRKSLNKAVGHQYILAYDFFGKSFTGVGYDKKKERANKA